MKRFLYSFFLLYLAIAPSVGGFKVFAYDPIDTQKALNEPPSNLPDINYIPVDTKKVPVSTYTRIVTISENFPDQPYCAISDFFGNCLLTKYRWQKIDVVHQNVGDFRNWTNYGPYYLNLHFGNPYKTPLDDASVKEAFSSYSIGNVSGASNAARRFLDEKTIYCLVGKRMWDAVETLVVPQTNNPRRTDVDTIVDKTSNIRISQVAYALAGKPIFFDPSGPSCNAQRKGSTLPGKFTSFLAKKYPSLPGADYNKLYLNAIEPINENAIGGLVQQCDLKDRPPVEDGPCKPKEYRALLQSGGYPGNGVEVMNWIMPAKHQTNSTTYGDPTADSPKSNLLSNPINFPAKYTYQYLYEGEHPGTQSGPTKLIYDIPQNLENAIRTSEAAMRWIIPQKTYATKGYDSLAGSSTDGLTIDPGLKDSQIRHEVKCQLLPLAWQSTDCNPNANIGSTSPNTNCPAEFNPYSQARPDNYKDILHGYCGAAQASSGKYGVSVGTIFAVIISESNYGFANAFMKANGVTGLMGVISSDCSKEAFGNEFKDQPTAQQLLDPATNIDAGSKNLKAFSTVNGGDISKTIFQYEGGVFYQQQLAKAKAAGNAEQIKFFQGWLDNVNKVNAGIVDTARRYETFCNSN